MPSIHQPTTATYLRLLHTQEVRGSSPRTPTTPSSEINDIEPGNGLQQGNDPPPADVDGSHSESQLSPRGSRPFQNFEKFAGSESDPSRSTTSACTGEGQTTPDGCKMSARRPSVVDSIRRAA